MQETHVTQLISRDSPHQLRNPKLYLVLHSMCSAMSSVTVPSYNMEHNGRGLVIDLGTLITMYIILLLVVVHAVLYNIAT